MELSKRIKELRINKGLTQTDLSDKSGISLRTIQRIEIMKFLHQFIL